MRRRDLLKLFGTGIAAATISCTPEQAQKAHEAGQAARDTAAATGTPVATTFFTPHEHATVAMLADMIIPRDDRSGSASEAGVPEFMDYILTEYPDGQGAIRGGLAWLDHECDMRFNTQFVRVGEPERRSLLDEIAWPKKAKPGLSQGVAFFNRFRDFTASGFFSSKMGVEDLRYIGNTVVPDWKGCPPEALEKLGVSYEGYA